MTYPEIRLANICNDTIYEMAIGAGAAIAVTHASLTPVRDPVLFTLVTSIFQTFNPLLTYGGFDGILKRRVNHLSPMLSTALIGGLVLYTLPPVYNITLSTEARNLTICGIVFTAIAKGITRKVMTEINGARELNPVTPAVFPSLKPFVIDFPCEVASTVADLYEGVKSSQVVKAASRKIYWAWMRFRGNPCNEASLEQKDV